MQPGRPTLIRTLLVAVALLVSLVGIIALMGPAGATGHHTGAEPIPNCPAAGPQCRIDVTVSQASPMIPCDSFTVDNGACIGKSSGTPQWIEPSYEPKFGLETNFTWKSSGQARLISYQVYATLLVIRAQISGRVPSPGSAELDVTDATIHNSSVHWHTGNSAGPGQPGGPLYIDYDNSKFGRTKIHMYGVLEPK